MNFRAVTKYMGDILVLEGIVMVPCLAVALIYGEKDCLIPFGATIAICIVLGTLLSKIKQDSRGIYAKEGYVSVALGWIVLSLFGSLPFIFTGCIPRFADAWFETVSGFTTTGGSILTRVEWLPKSILYWRSFTHWLGGMGVLVFLMAVVPMSKGKGGGEGLQLMRAESPGPTVGKLTPTLRSTARILYGMYIVLTILEIIFLKIGGMPLFDCIVNSFATAGTGGYSITNNGMAAYNHYCQFILAFFMMLFGVNFSIYYLILAKKIGEVLANEEFKWYIGIMLGATLLVFVNIVSTYESAPVALLDSYFQVSSIMTTTGFSTVDFDLWPQFSRILLVILMICGASAGSTGGGMKVSRIVILFKASMREVGNIIRPNQVKTITMDKKPVSEGVVRNTFSFRAMYCGIVVLSIIILSAIDGLDTETTITAVLACINNIGPGLGLVGPTRNFSMFNDISKIILSMCMLFGRLEIFPMMVLFNPATYKNVKRKTKVSQTEA